MNWINRYIMTGRIHYFSLKELINLQIIIYGIFISQLIFNFIVVMTTQDYSYYIFNLLCILAFVLLFRNRYEIILALSFFFIYSLFNLIGIYLNNIQYGIPITFPDESNFYGLSFYYTNIVNSIDWVGIYFFDIIDIVDWIGYHYIISPVGFIFSKFDENSFLALRQISVFFGTLSVVYIYKLILFFYKNQKESFYGAMLFGCLPYMLLYSSVLLRDVVILFFTIFTIVNLVYLKKSNFILNFALILMGLLIVFFLRPENGIFIAFVCLSYAIFTVVSNLNRSFKVILFFIIAFITLILLIFFYDDLTYRLFKTIRRYGEKSFDGASDGSLGITLNMLPLFIQASAKTFLSQLQPFPFWYHMDKYARFVDMLGGVLWFGIFLFSLITISWNKFRINISKELLILYIFSLIYIIFISMASLNPRRLFIFYPIIYTVAFIGFLQLSNYNKKIYIILVLCVIFLLHICYLFLKNGMNL
ncbi:hypothetical protein ACOTVM_05730 [Aliarcobacter butzleri]